MSIGFLSKRYSIKVNIAYLLIFVLVWVFGLYGAVNRGDIFSSLSFQVLFFCYLAILMVVLIWQGERNKKYFSLSFSLFGKELLFLFLLLILWPLVLSERLGHSIVNDQLYYARIANIHAISIISFLRNAIQIDNIEYKSLVQVLNIGLLSCFMVFFWFLRKIRKNIFFLSLSLILLLFSFRLIVLYFDLRMVHPPLQLFPLWISSTLFGVDDSSFRGAQILGLIILNWIAFLFMLRRGLTFLNASLSSAALVSIPIILQMSTMVESSVWTALLWVTILSFLFFLRSSQYNLFVALSALISIFILLRIPSFLIVIVFLIYYIRSFKIHSRGYKQNSFNIFLPLLVSMPFLLQSVIEGTPATFRSSESLNLIGVDSILGAIKYAISEGIIVSNIISSTSVFSFFLLIGFFLTNARLKNFHSSVVITIGFFLLSVLMFYSVRPVLWNLEKYLVEYLFPFLMIGGMLFFVWLGAQRYLRLFIPFIAFSLAAHGAYDFKFGPLTNFRLGDNSIVHEKVFDYKGALLNAKEYGFSSNVLIAGVTYGTMPQIISGYTVGDIVSLSRILKSDYYLDNKWTYFDSKKIHLNQNIKAVVVSDCSNCTELKKLLMDLGWKETYISDAYENYTSLLVRGVS